MNVWSDYKNHISNTWGIKTIDSSKEFKEIAAEHNLLICTGCSAQKKDDGGYYKPSELYLGAKNINFYRMMISNKYEFGTLSDLHGLCLEDELYTSYDVHPSQLTDDDFKKFGEDIREKMDKKGYNAVLYYNPSPIMGSPYFKMLSHLGLPVYYFTKLDITAKRISLF